MPQILASSQLLPVSGKPDAGEAAPKLTRQNTKPELFEPTKSPEKIPERPKLIIPDTSDLHYSVDPTASSLVVKITSKSSGEVIRTFSFKDFSPDVHLISKLAGHLVDRKT